MWKRRTLLLCVVAAFSIPTWSYEHDQRLYGIWRVRNYEVQGVPHAITGLVVITDKYLLSNAIFQLEGAAEPQANANAGPYTLRNGNIVLLQEMQLHWRPGENATQNFLHQNVEEIIPYRFDGKNLVFSFPSGNRYVLERAR